MRTTLLFFLAAVLVCRLPAAEQRAAKGRVLYLADAEAKRVDLEVLDLELDEDGSLHNGWKKCSFDDYRHSFRLWRKSGGLDPLVELRLYLALPSNNNLKRIREIIAFFDSEKVPWQLQVLNEDYPVPGHLRTKSSKKKR